MSVFKKLTDDMKAAMKSGEKEKLTTIRLLRGNLKDAAIDKRADLTSDEELSVLTSAAKKRREAITAYEEAGRHDLAKKEKFELDIIQAYLPKPLSSEEIEKIVDSAIQQVDAISIKDLGKVMPVIMAQVKGRADGKTINELVRQKLN